MCGISTRQGRNHDLGKPDRQSPHGAGCQRSTAAAAEREHSMNYTLTTLHKDRVMAQEYVYQMKGIIYEKKITLLDSSSVSNQTDLNKKFETLVDVFGTTKLTRNESKIFNSLKEDFEKIKSIEKSREDNSKKFLKVERDYLKGIKTDLDNLSIIQMSESKNLIDLAQKSLDNNSFISKLEIGFLILIGIVLQFLLFYRVKKQDKNIEETV